MGGDNPLSSFPSFRFLTFPFQNHEKFESVTPGVDDSILRVPFTVLATKAAVVKVLTCSVRVSFFDEEALIRIKLMFLRPAHSCIGRSCPPWFLPP